LRGKEAPAIHSTMREVPCVVMADGVTFVR
jgi:hypothetical protein